MKPEEFELDEDWQKVRRQVLWFVMKAAGIKSPFPPPQRGTRCRIYPVPS